jgi:hypothetical protein
MAQSVEATFFAGERMDKYYPPVGKRGRRRAPVINGFIEEKMERATSAKRFEDFTITNHNSLVVHYVVEDGSGQETRVKERLTRGNPADLEVLRRHLLEIYFDATLEPSGAGIAHGQ